MEREQEIVFTEGITAGLTPLPGKIKIDFGDETARFYIGRQVFKRWKDKDPELVGGTRTLTASQLQWLQLLDLANEYYELYS